MSQYSALPVTLVAGFLGSGKTSLLNHILAGEHGLHIAVMVNDFGAINIDSQLIVNRSKSAISLSNGCMCCTVESDLIAQLERLLLDKTTLLDCLLIEASGVSNPRRIVSTLNYPQFRGRLRLDGVLTVVDAEQFDALDGDFARLASDQLDAADIILLNKSDRVTPDKLEKFREFWLYPQARVIECQYGKVPIELLLDIRRKAPSCGKPQFRIVRPGHDLLFDSWSWRCEKPLSLSAFRQLLDTLPNGIYRAKGIIYFAEQPERRTILHRVGIRNELTPSDNWDTSPPYSQLIFIGPKDMLDTEQLKCALIACLSD